MPGLLPESDLKDSGGEVGSGDRLSMKRKRGGKEK